MTAAKLLPRGGNATDEQSHQDRGMGSGSGGGRGERAVVAARGDPPLAQEVLGRARAVERVAEHHHLLPARRLARYHLRRDAQQRTETQIVFC